MSVLLVSDPPSRVQTETACALDNAPRHLIMWKTEMTLGRDG